MFAKDYRDLARQSLGYNWFGPVWGNYAVIELIYLLITGACAGLSMYAVGAVALFLVSGPFLLALAKISSLVARGFSINIENLFDGFKRFGEAFVLYLLNTVFIFLWSLLFVIPGIIMSFAYSMSYYILNDNPQMTANEARLKSIEMMRGNKWRLFCLYLSFIGWFILCALTFGILTVWVMPYVQTATAHFYLSLLPESVERAPEHDAEPFDGYSSSDGTNNL